MVRNELTVLDVGLIICTFNRGALLAKALASVAALRMPDEVSLTVTVVDNSDDGNAGAVVDRVRGCLPCLLIYLQAHPANISVARNAGVRASTAEIIAFLDDDQVLDSQWLAAVAEAVRTHPHDVFFGRNDPVFEDANRAGPAARQLFSRWMPEASGHELRAMGRGKTNGFALSTANSIFRRSRTLTDAEAFDPAFGNAGGEDFDLFCRLQRRGRRFGWLPHARASETVPASRCEESYLRRRFFAGGQSYAAAIARNADRPALTRWWLRVSALVQGGVLALRWPIAWMNGEAARSEWSFRAAGMRGKLSLRDLYPLYREADAHKT